MDKMIRATAANAQVRAFACVSRDTVEEARIRHGLSPVACAALGRLMSGGVMMGAMLKGDDDIVTLQLIGDGPLGKATVTADSKGRVKGYVDNPDVMLPPNSLGKLDVGGAVGNGYLQVIKDMGLKEPYVSQLPLVSGEIGDDMTYYFAKSEQTPSAVGLGVLVDRDYSVKQAGGFILQLMPNAPDDVISALENRISETTSVTDLYESGMSSEEILAYLAKDFEYEILDRIPVEYYCNCSRERVSKALISLGKKEISKIIEEDGKANIHCHFCEKDYNFTKEELMKFL